MLISYCSLLKLSKPGVCNCNGNCCNGPYHTILIMLRAKHFNTVTHKNKFYKYKIIYNEFIQNIKLIVRYLKYSLINVSFDKRCGN